MVRFKFNEQNMLKLALLFFLQAQNEKSVKPDLFLPANS